jgi:hypothetical protein
LGTEPIGPAKVCVSGAGLAPGATKSMKVPIDDYACIDLDAPVLPAYEAFVSG